MKHRCFFIFIVISLLLVNFVFAVDMQPSRMKMHLQTLDNYLVSLSFVDDSRVKVTQSFDVVNKYKEAIIPGRAKMVLFKGLNPKNVVISIGGSRKAVPKEDIIVEDDNNVIYYEIWRPISRGEHLPVQVSFDSEIDTQGILFKQLSLSFGEPEIHIEKMTFSLSLPTGKTVTYSEPEISLKGKHSVLIDIPKDLIKNMDNQPVVVEYSSLPLPTLPFHGYWLWLILILMSLGIMIMKLLSKRNIELPNTNHS